MWLPQNRLAVVGSFAGLRQLQLCQLHADEALSRLLERLTSLQVQYPILVWQLLVVAVAQHVPHGCSGWAWALLTLLHVWCPSLTPQSRLPSPP